VRSDLKPLLLLLLLAFWSGSPMPADCTHERILMLENTRYFPRVSIDSLLAEG
jgi:hypothetical protein